MPWEWDQAGYTMASQHRVLLFWKLTVFFMAVLRLTSYMTQSTLLLVRNRLATYASETQLYSPSNWLSKKERWWRPQHLWKSPDIINPHRSKDVCYCVIMGGMTIISRKVKSYTQIKWNSLPYDILSLNFITIDICTNGRDTQYANHPMHPKRSEIRGGSTLALDISISLL